MFMRYRGGGIGHKYMRDIEAKYENMSRERLHGKQPHGEHRPPRAPNTDEPGGTSDSDGGPEDPTQPGAPHQDGPSTENPGSDGGGNDEDDEGDEDNDYVPSETGSSSDFVADSDEIASDFDYESYGLADP